MISSTYRRPGTQPSRPPVFEVSITIDEGSVDNQASVNSTGIPQEFKQDPRLLAGAWNQHLQILDGLKQGDAEQARQQMVDHIRFSKSLALTLFDRHQAEGDAAETMQWATPLQGPSK